MKLWFRERYKDISAKLKKKDSNIELLSTEQVRKAMCNHIARVDNPVLHVPHLKCKNLLGVKKDGGPKDTITGWLN